MPPLRIWVTEIGEPLPFEPDARLHRYGLFTRYLALRGHDVTWWTSTFSHAPKAHVLPGDAVRTVAGVTIRALHGPGYRRNVSLARMRHHAAFAEAFAAAARKLPPPDLLIAPIPTVEVAQRAVEFARERSVPCVVDIRDRWPDELVNVAPRVLRPIATRLAASLYEKAHFACRNADGILGVSDGEVDYGLALAGRGRSERDHFFPLGYSLGQLTAQSGSDAAQGWIESLQLEPDALVGCFVGTIGRYFDLETVVRAVERLRAEIPVQVVLAGSGSSLERVRRAARGSRGVVLPGWISGPQIAALLARSHFALAPYRADATMTFPNKPFEYMAGALPIVSTLRGQMEALLAEQRCGLTYRADSVDELCACIRTLARDEAERRALGARGRRLLEARFESEVVFRDAEAHLLRIAGSGKGASTAPKPEPAPRYAHS